MTSHIFFDASDLDRDSALKITRDALEGAQDGELFIEYKQSESVVFDDAKIKAASFDITKGFGLRSVVGDQSAYAHSSEISKAALKRAAQTVKSITTSESLDIAPRKTNQVLYSDDNPLEGMAFEDKVKLLGEIDHFVRAKDPRVRQVTVNLRGNWQAVQIIRPDGYEATDFRPFTYLSIAVTVEDKGRLESGRSVIGGRKFYSDITDAGTWTQHATRALTQALTNLQAIPAPAGEMPVVLGPGIPGVLLHEAVGHGLEGDFNRKGSSTFSNSMGKRVAADGVTVIDSGCVTDLAHAHGNLTIDDEGTPTTRAVLIENGMKTGHMQDRMNARLMGEAPTGNGRRESYAHIPMPRMTNTFMLPGKHTQAEMIESIDRGIFAVDFGGGQVDITSGKFVFSASEAYLIEGGKITAPVKGATLVGNGPDVMQKIVMIGNDLALDQGVGMCGKAGQSVPVGLGQPSVKISNITVGGTA